MPDERRSNVAPVPDDLEHMLSIEQLLSIHQIEQFGGRVWFVRRPLFQRVVPVVRCSSKTDGDIAVVEPDGSLNKNHGLVIRGS